MPGVVAMLAREAEGVEGCREGEVLAPATLAAHVAAWRKGCLHLCTIELPGDCREKWLPEPLASDHPHLPLVRLGRGEEEYMGWSLRARTGTRAGVCGEWACAGACA